MRHVLHHVDDRVILQIEYLRGALLPTRDEPPWFDDPESFALAIDTGLVTVMPDYGDMRRVASSSAGKRRASR